MTSHPAIASGSTLAGSFIVEHPTLLNLGFEWQIRGDANRNGTVAVQFRKVYGPGHVIAHNAIAYFHDRIGISTYGTPP